MLVQSSLFNSQRQTRIQVPLRLAPNISVNPAHIPLFGMPHHLVVYDERRCELHIRALLAKLHVVPETR